MTCETLAEPTASARAVAIASRSVSNFAARKKYSYTVISLPSSKKKPACLPFRFRATTYKCYARARSTTAQVSSPSQPAPEIGLSLRPVQPSFKAVGSVAQADPSCHFFFKKKSAAEKRGKNRTVHTQRRDLDLEGSCQRSRRG